MKTAYQVISVNAVCVDYDDGRSISYPKGTTFHADSNAPQVRRLLRNNDIRALSRSEQQPKPVKLGLSQADASLLKAHHDRKAKLRADAKSQPKAVSALVQKKGEVVQSPLSPYKPKSTDNEK
jgi:hypothetical protein